MSSNWKDFLRSFFRDEKMPLWCCIEAHHRDALEHRAIWRILDIRLRSPDQEDDAPAWQPINLSICHRRVFEELWNVNGLHGAVSCPILLYQWETTSRLFIIDNSIYSDLSPRILWICMNNETRCLMIRQANVSHNTEASNTKWSVNISRTSHRWIADEKAQNLNRYWHTTSNAYRHLNVTEHGFETF